MDPTLFPRLSGSAWDAGEFALWQTLNGLTTLIAAADDPAGVRQGAALSLYGIPFQRVIADDLPSLTEALEAAGYSLPLTIPAAGAPWTGFNNALTAALAEALTEGAA